MFYTMSERNFYEFIKVYSLFKDEYSLQISRELIRSSSSIVFTFIELVALKNGFAYAERYQH